MRARSRKLVASDETTVFAKPFLDPAMVKDGESDRRFPNPSRADESDGFEAFSESDDPLN